MTAAAPRASGRRKRYGEIPDRLRAWVQSVLGSPVVGTVEQVGPASPRGRLSPSTRTPYGPGPLDLSRSLPRWYRERSRV
jgi:hypothetical protein